MNLGLHGKRALVTGSTAGIGLAIAKSLAAEGASVWINGRTQDRVNEVLKEVQGEARGIVADPSNSAGCDTLFAAVDEIDILVNNLGILRTSRSLKSAMRIGFAFYRQMC